MVLVLEVVDVVEDNWEDVVDDVVLVENVVAELDEDFVVEEDDDDDIDVVDIEELDVEAELTCTAAKLAFGAVDLRM